MTNLQDLLARVEAAKGPDREIDANVHCIDTGITFLKFIRVKSSQVTDYRPLGLAVAFRTSAGDSSMSKPRRFTGSLDAVVAMIERVLPGECWGVSKGADDALPDAYISVPRRDKDWRYLKSSAGATPALALLGAAIKAIIEKEPAP